jgi:hypothetical protein
MTLTLANVLMSLGLGLILIALIAYVVRSW